VKDAKDDRKVSKAGSSHELTHLMDIIGDIRSTNSKIDKAANQMPIESEVKKRLAIM
jgi:hypothetical protein